MNLMRHSMVLWAISLATVPFSYCLASAQAPPCLPVSQSPKSLEGLSLKPGKYSLTLVSTSDAKKGAIVNGDLILIPTSQADVSPKSGKKAYDNENLSRTPLYGSVTIDFAAVAAPVSDLTGSLDPIYPDVLVHVIDFKGIKGQPVVVIGSVGNRRDGEMVLDGAGIGLFVKNISEEGFAGSWDAWGIVRGGRGYFCAYRTADR